MATREGRIRVTLDRGTFRSQLRGMTSDVSVAGRKMGKAMSGPMAAGFGAARKSLGGMMGSMKNGARQIATFGGAIGTASLIRDSLKIHKVYRDIAFNISKLPGQAMEWEQVQELVTGAAAKTGQTAEAMAAAFDSVFRSTGNLEYSKSVLEEMGSAATASGKEAQEFADIAGMLHRKWGATGDQAGEYMTRFVEKIGVGGADLENLSTRFDTMAGEAKNAGVVGAEGITRLLGVIQEVDATMGAAKAIPAMKVLLQYTKDGTTQMARFKKEAGLKFDPGLDAFEKIEKILESEKALKLAPSIFTADAGLLFEELSKPFRDAVKEAKAAGLGAKAAREQGIEAFRHSIQKASQSSMKYSDLLYEAQQRIDADPTIKLRMAIEKVKEAFAKPKMIAAIDKIADKLPILAEKFAELISWITENPMKAAGAGIGLKLGISGVGGILGALGKSAWGKIFGTGAGAAASTAASTAATTGATTATGALAGVAGAGAAVLGAGVAGAGIGTVIHKFAFDPIAQKNFDTLEAANQSRFIAAEGIKSGRSSDALKRINEIATQLPGASVGPASGIQMIHSLFGDAKSPLEQAKTGFAELAKAKKSLIEAMEAEKTGYARANQKMREFIDTMDTANQKAGGGTARGPMALPVLDGSKPVGVGQ